MGPIWVPYGSLMVPYGYSMEYSYIILGTQGAGQPPIGASYTGNSTVAPMFLVSVQVQGSLLVFGWACGPRGSGRLS